MIYIVVIALIILSIRYLKYNYSTYIKCISLYLFSMASLLFFSLLQIIKISNYHPSGYIDYYLFFFFSKAKFFYLDISAMIILCFAAVAYSIYLMGVFSVEIKKKTLWSAIGSIPLCFFTFLNNPHTSFRLYLYSQTMHYPITLIERYISTINAGILFIYLFLPYVILLRFFLRTNYYIRKRNYILIAIMILTSEILFALLFFSGPLMEIFKTNISLLKTTHISVSSNLSLLIVICILLALALIITDILKKLPFFESWFNSLPFFTSGYTLSRNLRMTLHSYKNFFFAIEKLAYIQKKHIEEQNIEKVLELNNMIETIAHKTVNTLCMQLDMLRDLRVTPKLLRLSDLIHASAEKAAISNQIDLRISGSDKNICVVADRMHIEEVFLNLLANAASAVESKHNDNSGKINIEISSEDDWSCVRVTDNGVGISKANQRKVFNMLFSTKQKNGNFGIGLYYVKKVIIAHNGYIRVKSREGEYTTFEVFLPAVIGKQ